MFLISLMIRNGLLHIWLKKELRAAPMQSVSLKSIWNSASRWSCRIPPLIPSDSWEAKPFSGLQFLLLLNCSAYSFSLLEWFGRICYTTVLKRYDRTDLSVCWSVALWLRLHFTYTWYLRSAQVETVKVQTDSYCVFFGFDESIDSADWQCWTLEVINSASWDIGNL